MKNKTQLYDEDLKKEDNIKFFSAKNFYWMEKKISDHLVNQLIENLGVSDTYAKLLSCRGIDKENFNNFINPKIKNLLPDPSLIDDMKSATDIIVSHILKKKKIGLFGDYDVDGTTSTALFANFLNEIGCEFEFHIPDRINEGYGPNINSLRMLKEKSCGLILTLDCGTTANSAINQITDEGVKVIIVDHHLQDNELPNALAVINPNKKNDNSKLNNLCAVGVVFLLIVSINRDLKKQKYFKENSPNLLKYLDLVALGTICDLVKLDITNRALVKQGLKIINQSNNLGIKSLIKAVGINEQINEYHLGYFIGPRINAGGRVGNSLLGTQLLTEVESSKSQIFALKLDEFNSLRKKIEQNVVLEAISKVDKNENGIICVSSLDWHPGVIGIVASKITEKFQRPSIIISESQEVCKASCRSVKNFNIGRLIFEAVNRGICLSGGGHEMAGGFSIEKAKIEIFKEFLINKYDKKKNEIIKLYDTEISFSNLSFDLFKFQEKLAPFGQGNSKPKYLIKNCYIRFAKAVGNGHLTCFIEDQYGNRKKGIAFNAFDYDLGDVIENTGHEGIDLIVTLKINNWNDKSAIELQIEDVLIG
ncbi:MAG: Single-stranded-DNA-specific exonuclease RecJ [Alphaproteobacteria bacterium MarineAlpha8_Bin1]|nr:MAG: Single-stranded-DNA-specific exonuclease RecJ [Alphaproteobacteria bacterium MarineAlpha8_Bin1]